MHSWASQALPLAVHVKAWRAVGSGKEPRATSRVSHRRPRETPAGGGKVKLQRPWPDLSCLHGSRSAGKTTAMHVPIAMVHGCGTTVRCCGRARGPVGRCLLLRVSSVDHFGAVGLAPLSRGSKDSAMRGRCDSCLLSLPPSGLFQEGRTHTFP